MNLKFIGVKGHLLLKRSVKEIKVLNLKIIQAENKCGRICFTYIMFGFCLYSVLHPIQVMIIGEGLQILFYTLHTVPLSSEGSLACYNHCDTGHWIIMVISEDTQTCCRVFGSGAVTTCTGTCLDN